jgi:hypothetical protein
VVGLPVFVNVLRRPGIDSASLCSMAAWYGNPICRTSPPRLHRLAEPMPRNRFEGSINVYKYGLSFIPDKKKDSIISSFVLALSQST